MWVWEDWSVLILLVPLTPDLCSHCPPWALAAPYLLGSRLLSASLLADEAITSSQAQEATASPTKEEEEEENEEEEEVKEEEAEEEEKEETKEEEEGKIQMLLS